MAQPKAAARNALLQHDGDLQPQMVIAPSSMARNISLAVPARRSSSRDSGSADSVRILFTSNAHVLGVARLVVADSDGPVLPSNVSQPQIKVGVTVYMHDIDVFREVCKAQTIHSTPAVPVGTEDEERLQITAVGPPMEL